MHGLFLTCFFYFALVSYFGALVPHWHALGPQLSLLTSASSEFHPFQSPPFFPKIPLFAGLVCAPMKQLLRSLEQESRQVECWAEWGELQISSGRCKNVLMALIGPLLPQTSAGKERQGHTNAWVDVKRMSTGFKNTRSRIPVQMATVFSASLEIDPLWQALVNVRIFCFFCLLQHDFYWNQTWSCQIALYWLFRSFNRLLQVYHIHTLIHKKLLHWGRFVCVYRCGTIFAWAHRELVNRWFNSFLLKGKLCFLHLKPCYLTVYD